MIKIIPPSLHCPVFDRSFKISIIWYEPTLWYQFWSKFISLLLPRLEILYRSVLMVVFFKAINYAGYWSYLTKKLPSDASVKTRSRLKLAAWTTLAFPYRHRVYPLGRDRRIRWHKHAMISCEVQVPSHRITQVIKLSTEGHARGGNRSCGLNLAASRKLQNRSGCRRAAGGGLGENGQR